MMLPILAKRTHINRSSSSASTMYALSLGGSIHDPTDPVGRLLFNVLAMVAEFESDLIQTAHQRRDKSSASEGSAARQAAEVEA